MAEMLNDLVAELGDFVAREAAAIRVAFQTLWSLPLADRLESGRCLDGLEFAELKDGRFLRFRYSGENNSDFREEDVVLISRGDPRSPLLVGNLHRVDDTGLWLEPNRHSMSISQELPRGRWVIDPSFIDLESFYRNALKDLAETVRGRERVLPLLSGERQPQVDLELFESASEQADKEGVNEAQSEAIAQGVATDLCHLVQGPPGTGKTFVLAHIAKQRVARGERVLIVAATHRAIHNALNMIRRVAPEITDIAKIGRRIYDPELQVSQYEAFSGSPLQQCDGGYVVGATPFSVRSHRLRAVDFDAVLIDEAGQVTTPLAIMAMLAANVYVPIGDHRQLPPVLQDPLARESPFASIFGCLAGGGFETMLDITYRMNAGLTRWPGESFYGGKLRPAKQNASRQLALPQAPRDFGDILAPEKPLVFVEMDHRGTRRYSDEEASLTANLLMALRSSGFPLAEVAVVVPFRRQARRIRMFLNVKKSILPQDASACVIDTVERMQGQEREVVIVSMTASEPAYVINLLNFLLQPQRLNVAVTRARSKAIILASEQLALADSMDPDALELIELWKSLRRASHVVHV